MKLKELRQAYQKTKEANACLGSQPQTCRFYDELHAIPGGAPTTTPHLYVDSCETGVSHNRDEDFGDEEDDEEGKVEDSAHQAREKPFSPTAKNCLSPWSQYPPNPGSWILKAEKAPLSRPLSIREMLLPPLFIPVGASFVAF
ncbi:hypothetical protein UY3_16876 [Chelonia mydas]|uniref:Uncharacterized protein n=1 Tax=Chelonia mydas TaxID=8469 RepID=M7AND5_CHEMY|nr:hypothetical protein UY3_16876 [Chelonia mydas]